MNCTVHHIQYTWCYDLRVKLGKKALVCQQEKGLRQYEVLCSEVLAILSTVLLAILAQVANIAYMNFSLSISKSTLHEVGGEDFVFICKFGNLKQEILPHTYVLIHISTYK